jgi:hypothetical protein
MIAFGLNLSLSRKLFEALPSEILSESDFLLEATMIEEADEECFEDRYQFSMGLRKISDST